MRRNRPPRLQYYETGNAGRVTIRGAQTAGRFAAHVAGHAGMMR
ncbi:MAG TPA: hypothetical protein VF703_01965 [Pyrinomonadaceae bacterium]